MRRRGLGASSTARAHRVIRIVCQNVALPYSISTVRPPALQHRAQHGKQNHNGRVNGIAPAKPGARGRMDTHRQSRGKAWPRPSARLHSIALIKVMPMIPATESVRENPSGAEPTLAQHD